MVASIAPSGPVEAQSNYTSFFGQYSRSAAPDCVDATATAVQKIASMMKTEAGRTSLASTFNACEPLAEEVRGRGRVEGGLYLTYMCTRDPTGLLLLLVDSH